MKKQSLFLLFLLPLFLQSRGQDSLAPVDVLHYDFHLSLSDTNDQIQGRAGIRLKLLAPASTIQLDLTGPMADGRGMQVLSVRDESGLLSFRQSAQVLTIDLENHYLKNQELKLRIVYQGVPDDGLIIGNNKYGHRGFFADNWPTRAHHWIPCHDEPTDKATVSYSVTAPLHYQVVANGIQTEEVILSDSLKLTRYEESVPIPPKVMVIGVAGFAVEREGSVQGVPVYSWVYPENKEAGYFDYSLALRILPFYMHHIGPYGYHKLANVQSKTRFGGLENANTIFYSENSVTGTRKAEALLAHEIAHQWFGNMATEAGWAHLWLSEGFATYMTLLYLEDRYGRDTLVEELKKNRATVVNWSRRWDHPVVDSAVSDYMQLLNPNSYQKGGWVLHMLRCELGDSLFWKSIQTYYARYAGSHASTEDFQRVCEQVSGRNLSVFFRQWLYSPGQPLIHLQWEFDSRKRMIRLHIEQLQSRLFSFPLDIRLLWPGNKAPLNKTLTIKERSSTFEFPAEGAPEKIIADPYTRLLFEEK